MSHFADANVILEILLPDRPKAAAAERALLKADDLKTSPLGAHLYVHFGKKGGLPLDQLLENITKYRFTAFGAEEIAWAVKLLNRVSSDA